MAVYKLLADEVVLFKDRCYAEDICINGKEQNLDGTLTLTNYNMIFTYKDDEGEKQFVAYLVNNIKVYNNTPQIKPLPNRAEKVEIYLTEEELYLSFDDKKIAKTFVAQATKLLKAAPKFDETLAKIKKGINNAMQVIHAVDDALGIDTVEMTKVAITQSAAKAGKTQSKGANFLDTLATGITVLDAGIKSHKNKTANQVAGDTANQLPASADDTSDQTE